MTFMYQYPMVHKKISMWDSKIRTNWTYWNPRIKDISLTFTWWDLINAIACWKRFLQKMKVLWMGIVMNWMILKLTSTYKKLYQWELSSSFTKTAAKNRSRNSNGIWRQVKKRHYKFWKIGFFSRSKKCSPLNQFMR